MTSVAVAHLSRESCVPRLAPAPLRIALLGCGNVGSAFAALAAREPGGMTITHALVRDSERPRPALESSTERVERGDLVFAHEPDVLVELLGGTEPARTLALEALRRGIPVVTANKSLLAVHGRELRRAAALTGTPLLYEAAVIAGVPFLGTFARRRHAAGVTRLVAIANGTSNYVLTHARESGGGIDAPLAEAQRLGYAEPDPSNDIDGIDAAEKLIVLLQHFASLDVRLDQLSVQGIRGIRAIDQDLARTLGGTLKPVILADWSAGLQACAAPAFVPDQHVLASVNGVENAILLSGGHGTLLFRGPGAGPDVTAGTVMDDVVEAATGVHPPTSNLSDTVPSEPVTSWLLTVSGDDVPGGDAISDLFAAHGVFFRRTTEDGRTFAALTWSASSERLEAAAHAVQSATGCDFRRFRALEQA